MSLAEASTCSRLAPLAASAALKTSTGGGLAGFTVLRRAVAALLREGKTPLIATTLQSGRKEGMLPLDACLADLVRAGTVTREAAATTATDASAFADYLAGRRSAG